MEERRLIVIPMFLKEFATIFFPAAQSKCFLSPCENGGSCIETMSGPGYECQCPAGFRGQSCEGNKEYLTSE